MIEKVEPRVGKAQKNEGQRRRRATDKVPTHDHGMAVTRYFTRPGVDPFDEVQWELRTASIAGESGKVYFEQKDVEVPTGWSQLATNVVVQKYFRGAVGTPGREKSVRQLISRVADTIAGWGVAQNYFATPADAETFRAEIKHLLVHQKMSFSLSYRLLTYLNCGGLVGRLGAGWIGDWLGRYNTQMGATFFCALSVLGIWLASADNAVVLVFFSVVFGIAAGSNISLTPVCLGQLCSADRYGRTFTAVYTVSSIG